MTDYTIVSNRLHSGCAAACRRVFTLSRQLFSQCHPGFSRMSILSWRYIYFRFWYFLSTSRGGRLFPSLYLPISKMFNHFKLTVSSTKCFMSKHSSHMFAITFNLNIYFQLWHTHSKKIIKIVHIYSHATWFRIAFFQFKNIWLRQFKN